MQKDFLIDFLTSKALYGVLLWLGVYFFGESSSQVLGMGLSFGQELVNSGILAGSALVVWSRAETAYKNVTSKSVIANHIDTIKQQSEGLFHARKQIDELVGKANKDVESPNSRPRPKPR